MFRIRAGSSVVNDPEPYKVHKQIVTFMGWFLRTLNLGSYCMIVVNECCSGKMQNCIRKVIFHVKA